MIYIKLFSKKVEGKRYPLTNFCFSTKELTCIKCFKAIDNEKYFYLCQDLDKVWHEECFSDEHDKRIFKNDQHWDRICQLKIMSKETFEAFESNIIELDI